MHITIDIPAGFFLPNEWNSFTPMEKYYAIVTGIHNLILFKQHITSASDEAEHIQKYEIYTAELKKRCEQDMIVTKKNQNP